MPVPQGGHVMTRSLTGLQELACIGLGSVMPIVVEVDEWIRRLRQIPPAAVPVEAAVTPARATGGV